MRVAIFMLLALIARTTVFAEVSIEIDLAKQKAFLLEDGEVIDESPIASGRYGHLTPRGDFEVLERASTTNLRSTERSSREAAACSSPTPTCTCQCRAGRDSWRRQ